MKSNLKKLSTLLILLMIVSCYNDRFDTIDYSLSVEDNNNELKKEVNLRSEFSLALAKVFAESKDVRELIKKEALKQFDYDYDVLYMLVKDKKIGNNKTLEELLLKYMNKENLLILIQEIPTLTIFVPSLPEESFSAEKWDIKQEIPFVAYKNEDNTISYVNSAGIVNTFEEDEIPVFPIVVIKPSERIVLQKGTRNSNSSTVLHAENGINFVFEFDEFDNVTSPQIKTRTSTTTIPDLFKKIYDAKKFSDQNDIWQRDYIYYNISKKDGKGVFQKNISECIYSLELLGDPNNMFRLIADQEGDPHYSETESLRPGSGSSRPKPKSRSEDYHRTQAGFWYGGNFEFLVKTYISNKQLSSNEIIKAVSIPPLHLFDLAIERNGRRPAKVVGINKMKKYYLPTPIPIFDWNIENYSTSIKISIEEKDNQETSMKTSETTSTFATNFEFNAGFKDIVKVGAKVSTSTTLKVSTVVTTYLNSDQLGDVIINFGDDIVVKDEMEIINSLVEYDQNGVRKTTDSYGPVLNPRYNSGYYKLGILPLPQY